ncbi:MAG: coproporphyrinogen III oxidase family protein [Proteobacteria bacterium]|nr:coproporphyrinogen III oxidase family protein [Pseudomonadota bacterium]MCP4917714.1 coproporphyrinogen III oxidase family protein [Pseudomonadota bacterium]
MKNRYGVYVHLPWCARRCHYCSFNVHVDPDRDERAYTDAVLAQWTAMRPAFTGAPETLAFGGGTPSLHPPDELARLVRALAPQGEVSLEANPESSEHVEAWRDAGVTRLSLGVQTLDARWTRFLNRAHGLEESHALIERVRAAGYPTWSVDLIFGLPGQSVADLEQDLDRLLAHEPPHVALYGLTVHPGTAFERAVQRGRLTPVDEGVWEAMYTMLIERLADAGLDRYEVSNFARPGHRSAHNEHYWTGRAYAGLGAGAHGLLPDGKRTIVPEEPAAFIRAPRAWETEEPSPEMAATDLVLSSIRHVDGLDLGALRRTGWGLAPDPVQRLVDADVLVAGPRRVRLDGRGWHLADHVTARLVAALRPSS